MYTFKIDKNIPITDKPLTKTRRYNKFQLEKLQVGHSFIYPGSLHGALSLMWQYRKKLGHDYVSGKTRYGNIRVWRVS